ncbi:MAG: hypothetical protein ACO29X_00935 [Arcobacteraceae bacterium]|jgi:hypothetical protein
MGFKKYIIASFAFLLIIAAYVYSIDSGLFTVKIDGLGINKTLPIYIWIIMPALVLFVATLVHMIFYGTKSYLQRNAIKKDISKMTMILNDRLLDKKSSLFLKTPELREIAEILNTVEIKIPVKYFEESPLIAGTVNTIKALNDGKYIPAKELKLAEDNVWAIKNTKNRLSIDDNYAIDVLKNASNYETEIIEFAFDIVLENKPLETIKKLTGNLILTNHMIMKLLQKDSEQLALTNHEILDYLKNNSFTNSDLVTIARNYKTTMQPEQLLKLFEDISAQNEYFTSSYLYILFEYQMLEKAREILVNSQKNEYIMYKALMDLKDNGKYNYNIDDFILE